MIRGISIIQILIFYVFSIFGQDLSITSQESEGCPPFNVEFETYGDYSQIISAHWDFGDGILSNYFPIHIHTYFLSGTYTITATFTYLININGSPVEKDTTIILNDYIEVYEVPLVSLSYQLIEYSCANNTFDIELTAEGNSSRPLSYYWNFGDGEELYSVFNKEIHQYKGPNESYYAYIGVINDVGCCDSSHKEIVTYYGVESSDSKSLITIVNAII